MKRTVKILVTVLTVAYGGFHRELAAESHKGGSVVQRPEAMVPEALAAQRLSELINACVVGRPFPPASTPAPQPSAPEIAPAPAADQLAEKAPPSKDIKEPSPEPENKPKAKDPRVAGLRNLLAKCSGCHSATVSQGESLADISLSFGAADEYSPGPKSASKIASAFAPGGKMASQLSLSPAEKQLLAAWSAASK